MLKKNRKSGLLKVLILLSTLVLTILNMKAQLHFPLPVNLSYFGETITHPGLKLGVEYQLATKDFIKTKNNGKEIRKLHSLLLTGNIGMYYQRRYNTGIFLNSEIGYRRTRKKGFKWEVFIGVGYLKTFLVEDAYSVDDNGEITRKRFQGQSGFLPSVAIGFGKDLGFTKDIPLAWHVKPSFYFQIPYNHTFNPHFVLEMGVVYNFSTLKSK